VVKNDGVSALRACFAERILTSPRRRRSRPRPSGRKNTSMPSARTMSPSASGRPGRARPTWRWPWRCRVAEEKVSRIILTRPAVEAGEALGFLPGDLYEKINPYLRPLHDALHDMLPAEDLQKTWNGA
jgi:phosphate starvation-inducible protein PhoH and related proteins